MINIQIGDDDGEGAGAGGTMKSREIGEIVLQVFRLTPMPGIPQSELPQSLDDCHRGLRHVNWHKVTYYEGVLTQLGGDCSVSNLAPFAPHMLLTLWNRLGEDDNFVSLAATLLPLTMSRNVQPQPLI